jgi:hypothetical protein
LRRQHRIIREEERMGMTARAVRFAVFGVAALGLVAAGCKGKEEAAPAYQTQKKKGGISVAAAVVPGADIKRRVWPGLLQYVLAGGVSHCSMKPWAFKVTGLHLPLLPKGWAPALPLRPPSPSRPSALDALPVNPTPFRLAPLR